MSDIRHTTGADKLMDSEVNQGKGSLQSMMVHSGQLWTGGGAHFTVRKGRVGQNQKEVQCASSSHTSPSVVPLLILKLMLSID